MSNTSETAVIYDSEYKIYYIVPNSEVLDVVDDNNTVVKVLPDTVTGLEYINERNSFITLDI